MYPTEYGGLWFMVFVKHSPPFKILESSLKNKLDTEKLFVDGIHEGRAHFSLGKRNSWTHGIFFIKS